MIDRATVVLALIGLCVPVPAAAEPLQAGPVPFPTPLPVPTPIVLRTVPVMRPPDVPHSRAPRTIRAAEAAGARGSETAFAHGLQTEATERAALYARRTQESQRRRASGRMLLAVPLRRAAP